MKYKLSQIVSEKATFYFYRCNIMYYKIIMPDDTTYTFHIDLSDIGNATLNNIEKGITLMRYIRKSIDDGTLLENDKLISK